MVLIAHYLNCLLLYAPTEAGWAELCSAYLSSISIRLDTHKILMTCTKRGDLEGDTALADGTGT